MDSAIERDRHLDSVFRSTALIYRFAILRVASRLEIPCFHPG